MKLSLFILLAALFAGAPTLTLACEDHAHSAQSEKKAKKHVKKAAKAKKTTKADRAPASRNCAQYARCRAAWCGPEAVKRCERGEDPTGMAKDKEQECRHWLTCEGMNCGKEAYERCLNGEDPNAEGEDEDDGSRPQPR